ncbi:hypothetical protein [Dactylosporangium sp. NPDC005555]|uniref:hypothetical protein n=1 Tax=Dactylosporangium sp. NPDC005555 TaxID=3154889 RepID=UPI00339F065E
MEAVFGVIGAFIGGTLVLLADVLRRRAERRQAAVDRIAEAATELAVRYGRFVGQLRDAHERGLPAGDAFAVRPDRYEANARFFMTPGSVELRPAAIELIQAYQELARVPSRRSPADGAYVRYLNAEIKLASAVNTIVVRGTIRRHQGPPPALPDRDPPEGGG